MWKSRGTHSIKALQDGFIFVFFIMSSSFQTLLSVPYFRTALPFTARGLHRRSGITPCPEDYFGCKDTKKLIPTYSNKVTHIQAQAHNRHFTTSDILQYFSYIVIMSRLYNRLMITICLNICYITKFPKRLNLIVSSYLATTFCFLCYSLAAGAA